MVKNTNTPERMLNDDERALLEHWATAGPDGAPIEKHAGKWTWEFRSLRAPKMYGTKHEARDGLEAYIAILLDGARVERERLYAADAETVEPQTADQELLSSAIKASGKSVRGFARDVLVREPRTVWRWLAGENALPAAVREKCQAMLRGAPYDDVRIKSGNKSRGTRYSLARAVTDVDAIVAECLYCSATIATKDNVFRREEIPDGGLRLTGVKCPGCARSYTFEFRRRPDSSLTADTVTDVVDE